MYNDRKTHLDRLPDKHMHYTSMFPNIPIPSLAYLGTICLLCSTIIVTGFVSAVEFQDYIQSFHGNEKEIKTQFHKLPDTPDWHIIINNSQK